MIVFHCLCFDRISFLNSYLFSEQNKMDAKMDDFLGLKLLIGRCMVPGKVCKPFFLKEGKSILRLLEQQEFNVGLMMSRVFLKGMSDHITTCGDHAAINPGEIAEAIKGMGIGQVIFFLIRARARASARARMDDPTSGRTASS